MAPTRPLVKQQIDACYEIMGIPQEVTAELTGSKVQTSRSDVWKEKRVFFVTPQILQNDLSYFPDLLTDIKCIVFDEAHRAKGGYAYCEVVKRMVQGNSHFRVLALSATPGNTLNGVIEVSAIEHVSVSSRNSSNEREFPETNSTRFDSFSSHAIVHL